MELWVWSILLLLLGFIFILLELFIPSSGLLGVLAAGSILGSLILAFMYDLRLGAVMLTITAVAVPVFLAVAVRVWPHTPIGRLIFMKPPRSEDVLPDSEEYRGLRELVGRRGKAASKMLPSGDVKIDGRKYDAVSEGLPIDIGQPILVISVKMNHLVVRPVDADAPPPVKDAEDILARPVDSMGIEPLDEPLA